MSAYDGLALAEAAIASISPSCGARPFIFQFPAIKGRIFSSSQNLHQQNYEFRTVASSDTIAPGASKYSAPGTPS